jgi:hypothetical protein
MGQSPRASGLDASFVIAAARVAQARADALANEQRQKG